MDAKKAGLRRLLSFSAGSRGRILVAAALALAGTVMSLAQPLAAKAVIDAISAGRPFAGALVVLALALLFGAAAVAAGTLLMERTAERIVRRIRVRLAGRLLRTTIPATEASDPGDLVSRVTSDTTLIRTATTSGLGQLLTGTVGLVGALVLMATLDTALLGIAVLTLAMTGLLVTVVSSRVQRAVAAAQTSVGAIGSILTRALGAPKTVKAATAEDYELARVEGAADDAYRSGTSRATYTAAAGMASTLALELTLVGVLAIGGARVVTGALPVSSLIAFLLYTLYLSGPLVALVHSVTDVAQGLGASQRLSLLLDLPQEGGAAARDVTVADGPPAVRFDRVGFRYPSRDRPALQDVTLRFVPRTHSAIVGSSGAGKTTLLALLMRFYEPGTGEICVGGRTVADLPLRQLRSTIGLVEQDTPVLAGTIRENLVYGTEHPPSAERIEEVLEATRLSELLAGLPHGLDTVVGDRGLMLSGGERQRLAVARALLRRPQLLLLDEVTSQLDAVNELALRETITRVKEHCTLVVVAHRLSTVRTADQIVVMEAGRVRATGTHDTLLAHDPLYGALARTQLAPDTDPRAGALVGAGAGAEPALAGRPADARSTMQESGR